MTTVRIELGTFWIPDWYANH